MNKLIFILKISVIIAFTCSCTNTKVITGEIKAIQGDTVTVQGYRFKVLENVPKLNQTCTFTPTRNRAKVNSILITKN